MCVSPQMGAWRPASRPVAITVTSCLLLGAAVIASGCGDSEAERPSLRPGQTAVWLDVAPALGEPGKDVDAGIALIQALHADALVVRGVSAVFGDVPLVRTWPITQDLVTRFGPETLRPWRGAAGPHERQAPTEASEALATSLRAERLTLVVLGPFTNVASALGRDPSLVARVDRMIAVAGHPADGERKTADASLDAIALDPDAARFILESEIPLTLVSPNPTPQPVLGPAEVDRLAAGPVAARFLAEHLRDRLRYWQEQGADGIPTVAPIAVDLVAAPGQTGCTAATARLNGTRLQVGPALSGRAVTWCASPDAAFMSRLLTTLTDGEERSAQ